MVTDTRVVERWVKQIYGPVRRTVDGASERDDDEAVKMLEVARVWEEGVGRLMARIRENVDRERCEVRRAGRG